MYETLTGMPQTRTISTVGRILPSNSRPNRIYHSQVRSGLVPPGNYGVIDPGLGFSLNPFKLIGKLGKAVGGIFKDTSVTLPTDESGEGGGTFRLQDLGKIFRGTTVQVGGKPTPTFTERAGAAVESIPGGWLTVAGVGLGAVLLVTAMSRRGRG